MRSSCATRETLATCSHFARDDEHIANERKMSLRSHVAHDFSCGIESTTCFARHFYDTDIIIIEELKFNLIYGYILSILRMYANLSSILLSKLTIRTFFRSVYYVIFSFSLLGYLEFFEEMKLIYSLYFVQHNKRECGL